MRASYRPGDIVLVRFPFTNLESEKKRPALVISETSYSTNLKLYLMAMITSQIEAPEISGDLLIHEWQKSGLLYPSRLRLAKMATIEDSLIDKKMGVVSKFNHKPISKKLQEILKEWI